MQATVCSLLRKQGRPQLLLEVLEGQVSYGKGAQMMEDWLGGEASWLIKAKA